MKIGIDIDNVIADTYNDLSDYFNRYMGRNIDPARIAETFRRNRLKLFFYFLKAWRVRAITRVSLIEGAAETIRKWSASYHIRLITSRWPLFNRQTREWLKKHLIPYHELYHSRETEKYLKAEDCDIFIEDHLEECELLADHCPRVFLFDRPWNRRPPKKKNIIRVKNWQEIQQLI